MLRIVAILMLASTPAAAWEANSDGLCTLLHNEGAGSVRVAYDTSTQTYSISITSSRLWRSGPIFAMRFDGPQSNMISTNRHVISDDGMKLTVTDSGFGNVLDGLEFNQTATAVLGEQTLTFGLETAGPAVREFRECASGLRV